MRLQIDWAPAYELVASYRTYTSSPYPKVIEMGSAWVKQVRPRLPDWFDAESRAIPDDISFPSVLIGSCPGSRDAEALLTWLASMSGPDLFELVAAHLGDDVPPPSALVDVRNRYVRLLNAWNDAYFRSLDPGILEGLANEAERCRQQAETMAAGDLVALTTGGMRIEGPPDLTKVTLVPQHHLRPINFIDWLPGHCQIMYGADALPPAPGEVPPQLRRLIRALDDDSRLQILRALRQSPCTFTEVVEVAGLAKSTVHHHLVSLRAAGLVWVHTTGNSSNRYSLRTESLDLLGPALKAFLEGV